MRRKKHRRKLPDELLVIPNPDKVWHEKWKAGRNPLNIPHPFRCVCLGPPNVGKTLIVKNILLRANPPFEELKIIHCDPDYTKEYDDVDGEFLDEIPHPSELAGEVKTLFVLDDLEYKGMGKEQKSNLDRLFGNASTHKNISVILCSQDPFNVPVGVRRSRKTGLRSKTLQNIFESPIFMYKDEKGNSHNKKTDSLWIDMTKNTPYPMRKNGFTMIKKKL
jgi:hypothetical protein